MALQPAMGVLLGLAVLQQQPSLPQLLGILTVVLAGAAAPREGTRQVAAPADDTSAIHSELDLIG